ncbi:unnamed protein product [Microthlaspi erraticum]|uniref:Uncharacterized protein n=1 Tax=Microthlaspi erraticum TaxID=1685480 RepID=A0A6D2HUH0_9BRAS|nr:unnamed protein product [Microthlaspi erraticum]
MNLFNAAIRPVSLWISLEDVGDGRSRIAEICFGFASIPRWVTTYPRNSRGDGECAFRGVQLHPVFLQDSETFVVVLDVIFGLADLTSMSSI